MCRDGNACVHTCHAETLHYAQVLVQHARQSAIHFMQNMQTMQRHVDSGADEPVEFAGEAQQHCLASFKRYMLADLQAKYTAVAQRKARKALSAPGPDRIMPASTRAI